MITLEAMGVFCSYPGEFPYANTDDQCPHSSTHTPLSSCSVRTTALHLPALEVKQLLYVQFTIVYYVYICVCTSSTNKHLSVGRNDKKKTELKTVYLFSISISITLL